jgi:hypothetical protein
MVRQTLQGPSAAGGLWVTMCVPAPSSMMTEGGMQGPVSTGQGAGRAALWTGRGQVHVGHLASSLHHTMVTLVTTCAPAMAAALAQQQQRVVVFRQDLSGQSFTSGVPQGVQVHHPGQVRLPSQVHLSVSWSALISASALQQGHSRSRWAGQLCWT